MCQLDRFIVAQDQCINNVIQELNNNRKRTHWIWYIFPQCSGLGSSSTSIKYSIKSKQEAIDYLSNQILYDRLITCCNILLKSENHNIKDILGFPDDLKFKSCLTLFMNVNPKNLIFKTLLDKYFNGQECSQTRNFLSLY
ncbi:MAG: DUF1810 family protein [Flavobacteriales bacterium]|jgi:uncharacterized protein (DUF1810 family)|tara:strand:+ start:86 stop:505 length:420 start_codon:yes stop_codon:yes gene_type:complete